MPFKIVQTLEKGVANLTAVPSRWEKHGVLWWPPKHFTYKIQKIIKDENSTPGLGWITINCLLKRNNIRTYEEAYKEVGVMEQVTDTDNTDYQEDMANSLPLPGTSTDLGNLAPVQRGRARDIVIQEEEYFKPTSQLKRNIINFEDMANDMMPLPGTSTDFGDLAPVQRGRARDIVIQEEEYFKPTSQLKRNNINFEDLPLPGTSTDLGDLAPVQRGRARDIVIQEEEYFKPTSQLKGNNINFEDMAVMLNRHTKTASNKLAVEGQDKEKAQFLSSENFNADVLANQSLIINKLNSIIDNQKRFAHKLACLTIQLDDTNTKVIQLQKPESNVTLLANASQEERDSFSLKPIDNNEEFKFFEHSLEEKSHRKKLINNLSTLFSTKPGEGQSCAYRLLDVLFTKEFLCQCSWSGGSKGEHSKIPWKDFKNFRKFFLDIIRQWDPSFTDDQMTIFFKIVLRNANKRKSMQGKRESTKRVRKVSNTATIVNDAVTEVGNEENNVNVAVTKENNKETNVNNQETDVLNEVTNVMQP